MEILSKTMHYLASALRPQVSAFHLVFRILVRLVRRCDWFPSVKTCTQCWYIVLFIFSPPCRKWGDLGTELMVSGAHIVGWCSMVRCLILVRKLPTYRFFHAVYGALYDIDFYHIVEFFGMIFRGVLLPSSDSKAGICLRYSSALTRLPAEKPDIPKFCVVLYMSGMIVFVEIDRLLS